MMNLDFLYTIPLSTIFIALLVGLPLCGFIGFKLGQLVRRTNHHEAEYSGFVPSTILGLLALILGFTLSMAVTRFEERKQLVLKEANSIGTSYLRADILNEPFRSRVQQILRQYVDARIAFFDVGYDKAKINEILKASSDLQNQLWKEVVAVTEKDHRTVVNLFVTEINSVIDIAGERLLANENHVPELVYMIIFIVTAMGLMSIGYIEGASGKHTQFGMFVLTFLFAVVIVMIQDLDRPRRGLIRVQQHALHMLKDSFKAE